ncbi:hypothetical protein WSM22_34820 [Cytophagales bacterium WSM2-2]|nr:hypothetical protein WSM22_34820 [Cytophagales bacterium WSM2-2]
MRKSSPITSWLENAHPFWFSLYTAITAFCLYSCVYGFRKAFSVATFDDLYFLNVSYKVWLVCAQVAGYALSKFAGIKIISELKAENRSQGIKILIAIAGISWFLFAVTPAPLNILFLFTNGMPLGMIWGMIFHHLEGRRTTEILGAGLSVSFIFSAGFAKSVGGLIMRDWGASEYWMPFVTSCLFTLPLLAFLWLLEQVPPPSSLDEKLRTKRQPMSGPERKKFLYEFAPGIILFVLSYMLLTAFRDFRDNFSAELWKSLGYGNSPEIFTQTEIPISLAVLIVMGSMILIKNNEAALLTNLTLIIAGLLLIGGSTFLFEQNHITPLQWMILSGLGLYFGYVPFNSILFDRLLASFKIAGTVGFVMYVCDAFGYLGSVGVLFIKEFSPLKISWLNFFIRSAYAISICGTVLIAASMIYFYQKQRRFQIQN